LTPGDGSTPRQGCGTRNSQVEQDEERVNTTDLMDAKTQIGRAKAVLLVEDEPDQASLIQEAFQRARFPYIVRRVPTGELAIAYLSGEGEFADRKANPFPTLVLLDLRMRGIGGFGVLRWLQTKSDLRKLLTVVVLSETQSEKEIDVVYELGAHSFWSKSDFETLSKNIHSLENTWLGLK
jgi:CheY-like chemotaxis protein